MKTMRRIGALMCAMALVFSLAACGNDKGGGATDTDVAAVLTVAKEKAAAAKSMEATMTMDMAMNVSAEGESQDINMLMDMNMVLFNEPVKMKIDMAMDMGEMNAAIGGPIETEMYATEADGVYTLYTNTMGTWTSETLDLGDMAQYNPQGSMDLYLDKIEFLKDAGSDTVNGVKATKYTGVITGAALEEVMDASGVANSMGSMMDTSGMDLSEIYKDMGDMPISIWIDEEGYPIRYEMDMKDIMAKIYDKLMAGMADTGMELSVTKVMVSMDVFNYDKATDFELPADIAG